jgi:hypothetical protein
MGLVTCLFGDNPAFMLSLDVLAHEQVMKAVLATMQARNVKSERLFQVSR